MPTLTPPVRAAAALLVLLTVVAITATGLYLVEAWETISRGEQQALAAVAGALAAAVQDDPASDRAQQLFARAAADRALDAAMLLDARGRPLAGSASETGQAMNGRGVIAAAGQAEAVQRVVRWNGRPHFLAVQSVEGDGRRVAVLRSDGAAHARFKPKAWRAVGAAFLGWLLVAGALAWWARQSGAAPAKRLQTLAERVASSSNLSEPALRQLLSQSTEDLGGLTGPLYTLGTALREARERAAELRTHAAALLQVNPHYVLIATQDGHLVDANPAFYAATGLPFEAIQNGRMEVLDEIFPLPPLLELAERSRREGSAISGVEYALVAHDDARRPVDVALRAITLGGRPAVIIQATDRATERKLERQISTFSDALDLMVDQRVAQLTAGNGSLNQMLEEAGVVVMTFDGIGRTRRWNRAAVDLAGSDVARAPHFRAFAELLRLPDDDYLAFAGWFEGEGQGTWQTDGRPMGMPRRLVWRKHVSDDEGVAERRMLVGVELPRRPISGLSGDGAGEPIPGFAPGPAPASSV